MTSPMHENKKCVYLRTHLPFTYTHFGQIDKFLIAQITNFPNDTIVFNIWSGFACVILT